MNIKNKEIKFVERSSDLSYLYKNKTEYNFKCSCGDVNMVLGKRDDTIYFSTKSGEKENHKWSCPFYGDTIKILKGYEELDNGDIRYNVALNEKREDLLFDKKIESEIDEIIKMEDEHKARDYINNNKIKKYKLTFRGFAEKILTESWNRYYIRTYCEPNYHINKISIYNFLNFFFGKSNQFHIGKYSVNDYMSGKHPMYAIGYNVLDVRAVDEIFTLHSTPKTLKFFCKNSKMDDHQLSVNTNIFNAAKKAVEGINFDSLIAIYVRDIKNKYKNIVNLVLIPVNKYGLYSESSYECRYYNRFIERGYLFKKPYEMVEGYGYVPDAIVSKDSKHETAPVFKEYDKNRDTIFEVFGMENDEKYDKNKEEKKKIGKDINENSDEYCFRYVDMGE